MSYLNLKITNCIGVTSLTLKNAKSDTPEATDHLIDMLHRMVNLSRLSLHGSSLDFSERLGNCFDTVALGLIKIRALDLSSTFGLCDVTLSFILKSCPNIEDLNLSSVNLSSKTFIFIEKLDRLVALKVGYPSQSTVKFDSNVEHCLMTIGANLKILDLSEFQKIPITLLSKLCRNIKELYMNGCTFEIRASDMIDFDGNVEEDNVAGSCSMLHTLEIGSALLRSHPYQRSGVYQNLEAAREELYIKRAIKQIRRFFIEPSNKRLERLRIGNCDKSLLESLFNELDDRILLSLTDLNMSGNMAITKPDVIQIVMNCPRLKHFLLLYTGLTKQEIESLKKLIQDSRIVTELHFSSH